LFLHDAESGTVRLVAYDGPKPDILPKGALAIDACLVSSAIHTRRAVEFANVQSLEFVDVNDLPREPGLRSMLATPLVIEEEIIGVLVVFTDQIHRFNNDEKRLESRCRRATKLPALCSSVPKRSHVTEKRTTHHLGPSRR
ncbi:MAG: GAF domain-containing protein, partial [Verrucomicrobiia bacterium]